MHVGKPNGAVPSTQELDEKQVVHCQAYAKHTNQHLRRRQRLLVRGDDLAVRIEDALESGNQLYRATFAVLQDITTALSMHPDDPTHSMWQVMQTGSRIRRVKFMEAVMLRYSLETTYSKRTDACNSVLKSSTDLLQADLDWLVMDIDAHNSSADTAAEMESVGAISGEEG